jgi:hypothetical protein
MRRYRAAVVEQFQVHLRRGAVRSVAGRPPSKRYSEDRGKRVTK